MSMSYMSDGCYREYWKINYLLRLQSVNFMSPQSASWASLWSGASSSQTLIRFGQCWFGLSPPTASNYRGFWVSLIFIDVLAGIIARLLLLYVDSSKLNFMWSSVAQSAFDQLKVLFSCSPVLVHPDSGLQLAVEVDASDTRVGAVLTQRSPSALELLGCRT